MTLKGIDPSELPATKRKSPNKRLLSEEQVAEAIELLRAGQAVTPEETFKSEAAARRKALLLKRYIDEGFGEAQEGEPVPSTRTWQDGNVWRCAVVLREKKQK